MTGLGHVTRRRSLLLSGALICGVAEAGNRAAAQSMNWLALPPVMRDNPGR